MGRDDVRDESGGRRRRRPRLRRTLGALAASAFVAVAAPSLAHAAPVTVSFDAASNVVTIHGTDQADDIYVSHGYTNDPGRLKVEQDSGGTVPLAGAGCVVDGDDTDRVSCPRPGRIVAHLRSGDDHFTVDTMGQVPVAIPVDVDGGDGDDVLDASTVGSILRGGPGDDWLRGDAGNDTLQGGAGDDRLDGHDGDDHLQGGDGNDGLNGHAGNDTLDGGAGDDDLEQSLIAPDRLVGADTYIGGPGFDRFSYFMRSEPVTVTLDGVANDGAAGEGDNVHPDVESVGGGWGDDTLIGSDGDNELWGDAGNDTIRGLGGNDKLYGDDGMDTIDGGPGDDYLKGGCHSDRIIGGPGIDTLISDDCSDLFKRGALDVLDAADGERDAMIFCSLSTEAPADTAIVDPIDPVTSTGAGACGTIQVVGAAPPPAGGGGGGGAPGGGGGVTPPAPTALTGTVSLRFGAHAALLTGAGNAKKQQAAKRQLRLKGKTRTLTLGTLRATSAKVKVTAVATFRKGTKRVRVGKRMVRRPNMVPLGRTTLTVTKAAPKTFTLRVPAKGAKAVGKAKRVKAKIAFTVRNSRGKVVSRATKTFPVAVVRR